MRPLPIDNPASYDFFYHGTVDREYPRINQSLENCTVLKAFGILTSDPREELFISTKENEWARTQLELLHIHKEPVILIPDAHIVNRIWPAEHFIELGKKILKHLPLLVLWGPRQEHLGEAVLRPLEKMGAKTIRNTTIREMAALFAHSNMVICNDTGSLHVSAAIGARTFGLHGPTDPYIYQAQGDHITAIKSPTGRIEDISVDQVLKEIQSILTGP
jgi:ADP-heptose:LPS heptosyltransferase